MVAFDGSKVPWICEFGLVPGCCPGEHHVPSVALALIASGDNNVYGSLLMLPSGMVAAVGGVGSF